MKALTSTVITIGMLALAAGAVVAQSGNDLFQQALVKERTEGNMAAAIALYQTIVEKHASERALVAKALVQMGHCYEKLQQQGEARNIYERVVRDYSNQKAALAAARTWLDAHGSNAGAQAGLRIEQVWTGPDVVPGRVSPDGRYLTFVDSTSGPGNLAVRDFKTGENRLLTRDATWNGYAGEGALVSPDGKQIAYCWVGMVAGKDDSIRLIGVDGKNMRILAHRGYGNFLAAWSPNGKQIAAVHHNLTDRTNELFLISAADGSMTQLKSTGSRFPNLGGFSPDGRFLVYSLEKDATGGNGGVFALATDASREIPLVQGSANDGAPVWSPDGQRVIFVSNRSGTNGLWSIRVADGRPEGSPELVRANIGNIRPMGFARDGAFYYGTQNSQTDAYTAEVDPQTLAVAKALLVTDRSVGSNFGPELSPDGKSVTFFRKPTAAGTPTTLIVRSSPTREERTLASLDSVVSGARNVQWFPDSHSLLLQDRVHDRTRFRTINVETGEARMLFEGPYDIWTTTALSPDGKVLFYSVTEGALNVGTLRLVKRRLETGEETELYRTSFLSGGLFGLTVSSDGRQLAFVVNTTDNKRALMIMPADGGAPRELHRTGYDGLYYNGAMIWTKDGGHIVFKGLCGPGGDQLCAIPSNGGELKPLGLRMANSTRMISADGRRIAFTGVTSKQELWAIRNLLSEPVKAR